MSGYGFAVGANGYDDEDRLVNWQRTDTNLIVARHSVSGLAAANHIQDVQQTIADYPSGATTSSPTYTYVYASYIDEPVMRGDSGGLRYNHRNQQYSITAVTDGGGSVVERYAYSAYGQVTFADEAGAVVSNSAISNRYTYTGREWDEGLSLYHYRARMYDAVSGRFVSRDPIGYEGSPWNQYEYTLGNPISLGDPLGLSSKPRPPYAPFCLAAVAACAPIQVTCLKTCYTMEAMPECMDRCCGPRGCRGSQVRVCSRKCEKQPHVHNSRCKWPGAANCDECMAKCYEAIPGPVAAACNAALFGCGLKTIFRCIVKWAPTQSGPLGPQNQAPQGILAPLQ